MSDSFVGAQTVATEVSEAIADIPRNRTLFIKQLTADAPAMPDVVHGLKNSAEVFDYFKPNIEVEFKKPDGSTLNETLAFNNVADFQPGNLKKQSALLSDLSNQQELYAKVMKQLRSNKLLANALAKEDTKGALLDALRGLMQELKDAK